MLIEQIKTSCLKHPIWKWMRHTCIILLRLESRWRYVLTLVWLHLLPFNPTLMTPRGIERIEKARRVSSSLIGDEGTVLRKEVLPCEALMVQVGRVW
jgi:hypothetical protein